jgi:hypothetical protein
VSTAEGSPVFRQTLQLPSSGYMALVLGSVLEVKLCWMIRSKMLTNRE